MHDVGEGGIREGARGRQEITSCGMNDLLTVARRGFSSLRRYREEGLGTLIILSLCVMILFLCSGCLCSPLLYVGPDVDLVCECCPWLRMEIPVRIRDLQRFRSAHVSLPCIPQSPQSDRILVPRSKIQSHSDFPPQTHFPTKPQ